jgi:hypothetical protein
MHTDTTAQMSAVVSALYLDLPAGFDPSPETRTLSRWFFRFGPTPFVPHPSSVRLENKRDAWWYDERSGTYLTQPA